MTTKAVRIGIDVGGTHTKAVAIDNETHEIIGKASVMTTHADALGVAAGIVQAFHNCLADHQIEPQTVVFIAHSTTQATNALLEGDVAKVGILGIGQGGLEGLLAKKQTKVGNIPLGTGKFIHTTHDYLKIKQVTAGPVQTSLEKLKGEGAQVLVASMAFGVDRHVEELFVKEKAQEMDLPCTMASEISKLYGLTTRTRTAAINASILPKMLETATSTQKSVEGAGIHVPLMMMRGDGGVMEVEEMKKRPVLTMLSGPAASVVGSLMYLRASNGIYFEVGGTSTNIGVIKNGRPTVDYAVVGGHRTYISSLDVRVLGVAGGSMVRVGDGKILDVGPRSAHITGLPYAAFTLAEKIVKPTVKLVQPKADDPSDYVSIRSETGTEVAITNTCAANVLGLVDPAYFAYGNQEACRLAMEPLADLLGLSVEETARQILQKSTEKIMRVIDELSSQYRLEPEQMVLMGVGGGAASLIPFTAQAMNLDYKIPENAEVISSIGVALAMVRDVVERVIPNPSSEDIDKIKREATELAIQSGAVSESIEVHLEIDAQSQKVTAIAMGSTEVRTTDLLKACSPEEAFKIAVDSMRVPAESARLTSHNENFYVVAAQTAKGHMLRVVDKKGFIKLQRRDGLVQEANLFSLNETLRSLWDTCMVYRSDTMITPDVYVILGSRWLDYSGISSLEQIHHILRTELVGVDESTSFILVVAKNDL